MEEPLCLWWRGDEHGGAGLLHDRLAGGALPWVRWGRLLPWRAQDPHLKGNQPGVTPQGALQEHPSLGASSCNGVSTEVMCKSLRKFPWRGMLWPGEAQIKEVQTNHSYSTDILHISDLRKYTLVIITISPLTLITPFISFVFHVFSNLI